MASWISDIRHFMLWEETQKRDVLKEFYNLEFLGENDALLLRDHCLLKADDVRKWLSYQNSTNVRALNKDFPSVPRVLDRVTGNQARTRFSRIVKYLAFTARAMLRLRPNIEQINEKIAEMEKRLLANKPKGGGSKSNANSDSKAPKQEVFDDLLEAVQFDSPRSPYKNQIAKKRNAMVFNILDATGIRASELLGLKLEDVDYQEKVIRVVRRHDDPDDPRQRQPTQKTLDRDIPVSEELVQQIRDYVLIERANTLGANKHPYLVIVHQKCKSRGAPLSNSGFTRFVTAAVKKMGQAAESYEQEALIDEITRHGFRHNFNYKLSKAFDKRNELAKTDPSVKAISEREQNQIRMYLNGWSSEETADEYNGRHIREEARELMLEDMQAQSEKIKTRRDKK
ncbi:MAG: site-specific integrase [Candidatus Thiodiazotropha taylori]|nr:site-specific integrase [Candidatus Thiodiazotropha taylori]MCW4327741.1 site-specific integrase [Candidatus Thiodiazotropha taylori]